MGIILVSADFGESFILEIAAIVILIVILLRWHLAIPLIRKMMNAKVESIRGQLAAGEEARVAAAELIAAGEVELAAARDESAKLLAQANESAGQIVADGRRRADAEHARIVARIDDALALERARVRDEVLERIGALVARAVDEVVTAELDEQSQRRLIGEAIDAAESRASA